MKVICPKAYALEDCEGCMHSEPHEEKSFCKDPSCSPTACPGACSQVDPVQDLITVAKTVLLRLDVEFEEQGPGAIFPCAALREDLRKAITKAEKVRPED